MIEFGEYKGNKLIKLMKGPDDKFPFSFGKTKDISIGDGWGETPVIGVSSKGSFLEAVRSGACKQFATVLGPGSDAYHGDHFHVDAIQRKNDYRICQ